MHWIRSMTALTWSAAGLTAAVWALPWWPALETPPGTALAEANSLAAPGSWAAFSPRTAAADIPTDAPAAAEASRFQLAGILGPAAATPAVGTVAVALLSVDGQPPRAYRVGDTIGGYRVESIAGQAVRLVPERGAAVVLQASPLPPAATGELAATVPGATPALTPAAIPAAIPAVGSFSAAGEPAPGGRIASRAAEVRERLRGGGLPRAAAD